MNTHKELGRLIDPEHFKTYVEIAASLPSFVHVYGSKMEVPSYPCWMEYSKEFGVEGSINFTRNTSKHPILSKMVDEVVLALKPVFPESNRPVRERIHLVRTIGDITSHKDEDGRLSCINIGVLNSESATTRMSTDGLFETFDTNHLDIRVKDGYGYLINTSNVHAVIGSSSPRYLLTYSFGTHFDILHPFMKSQPTI